MTSRFKEEVARAIFWLKRKVGWATNKSAHELPPYRTLKKIAILVHCEEKKYLREIIQLWDAFSIEGKQPALLLHRSRRDTKPALPLLERRHTLLWEKSTRKATKKEEYGVLIDTTQENLTALRATLYNTKAKSKIGIQSTPQRSVHDICFIEKGNKKNPLQHVHQYLKRMG